MKKQNIAIIAVVALVLAVAVGYALFSQTINITGTATANGSFDVIFVEEQGLAAVSCNAGFTGCDNGALAQNVSVKSITNNGHTLQITVNSLAYPGASVTIPFRVKNNGSISAQLVAIRQSGTDAAADGAQASVSGDTPSTGVANTSPTISVSTANANDPATAPAISIQYAGFATTDAVLASNQTHDGTITVTWNSQDQVARNVTLNFWVEMDYQQAN